MSEHSEHTASSSEDDQIRLAMDRFTRKGWPTEEWPEETWREAAIMLIDVGSVHEGDMSSIVAHLTLWN